MVSLVILKYFDEMIFKGCVCYVLASLFCMSKREHSWNKEKCFLFHFENSFRSWDNFNFSDIQMTWRHQMPKHETQNTLHILGTKHVLVMKFGQFMWYCKIKVFIKKYMKIWSGNYRPLCRPLCIFKESSVKRILKRSTCWFGQISITLILHI